MISSGSPGLHHVLAEADQLQRLVRVADAALDRVREMKKPGRLVVDADVDDLRVEDLLDLVADDVVDRLELELAGERGLDAVDQRELGVPLPGLLDRPGARECGADVLGDEGEQVEVVLGVLMLARVRLDDEHTDRLALGEERRADPARVLRHHAEELDLALLDQLQQRSCGMSWGFPVRRT